MIDGDKDRLHLCRIGAQNIKGIGNNLKLGRTYVRTVGVAEKDQHELAAIALVSDVLPVVIDQRERAAWLQKRSYIHPTPVIRRAVHVKDRGKGRNDSNAADDGYDDRKTKSVHVLPPIFNN